MVHTEINIPGKFLIEDVAAFEKLFREFNAGLCHYACSYVGSMDFAKEVVQEVFVRIWENRQTLEVKSSIKSYLFRAVHNNSLTHIKNKKLTQELDNELQDDSEVEDWDISKNKDIYKEILVALETLPEKNKEIFILSRIDGLKHKEIAEKLNISPKTVEVQIRRASIALREKLKDYAPVLILLFKMDYY